MKLNLYQKFNKNNGIPIKSWHFDKSDSETVFADSDDTVAAIDEALEALNSNSETAEDTLGNVVDEITDKVDLVTEEVTDKVDEVKNEEQDRGMAV